MESKPYFQDIQFTVENGRLFLLGAQPGRRTPQASVRVAVALVHEKLLTEREALLRIDAKKMDYFLHPIIDPKIGNINLCFSSKSFIYLFYIKM
jgi:pyruvate,orthophosphate dikinase